VRSWVAGFVLTAWLISGCSHLPSRDVATPSTDQTPPLAANLSAEQRLDFTLNLLEQALVDASTPQNYQNIEQNLLQLRRSAPDDVRIYRLLIETYIQDSRMDLAYVTAKELVKLPQASLDDEDVFASIALSLEDYVTAEAVYLGWLDQAAIHTQVAALNNLGFSSLLQRNWSQAEDYFSIALERDPLNQRARHNLVLLMTLRDQQ
jgi:tetratricopeptide (TPR) repeat protein